MARAGSVGVGEFIDQGDLRTAGEKTIDVEFRDLGVAVFEIYQGKQFQSFQQRRSVLSAVGFDHSSDDINVLFTKLTRRLEHRVGLAHARAHAEEDFEFATDGWRIRHESVVTPF